MRTWSPMFQQEPTVWSFKIITSWSNHGKRKNVCWLSICISDSISVFLTLPWSNMCKKNHDVFLYSVIIMSNIVHQWGQDNCTMKILANIWTDHVKAKGICPISYKSKGVCQKVVITKIRNPTWLISFVHQHQQPFIVCWEKFVPRNWSWTDISQKWQLLTVIVLRSQNDANQRLFST